MMYKCENCGHLFEEGEQARWVEEHGEKWDGCPMCKGGYEEVHQCQVCDEWHTEDELYEGWCEKCLREAINYDSFFEYCEANKDELYLDIFVMSELLGGMDCPKNISWDFHKLMVETYKRRVADAKLIGGSEHFFSSCIRFVMDDDGECGRENFAEWLNKREVK